MGVNAGTLRHRVTFQQKSNLQDALGQPVQIWVDLVVAPTRFANVRFQNGKEYILANKTSNQLEASIRIRHCTDILPNMRVVFKGEFFNITAVLPNGTNEWVDLVCLKE